MADQTKSLGLIAGNGKFPVLLAHEARRKKYKIFAIAIKKDTSFFLKFIVDEIFWIGPGELRKLFSWFKQRNVREVIMAGQVNPKNLFNEKVMVDEDFQKLFNALQDRKADTIFRAVADKLKEEGLELLNSIFLLENYLAPSGTLTHRGPTVQEREDIAFGRDIAKQMGSIDIGQTVVIKQKAIVAIEAMEGTDRAILRGCKIARQGAVIIKTSKPQQDLRFDVPVVGPKTIQVMIRAKASCLAIEAEKTLMIEKENCIKLANKHHICVVGV